MAMARATLYKRKPLPPRRKTLQGQRDSVVMTCRASLFVMPPKGGPTCQDQCVRYHQAHLQVNFIKLNDRIEQGDVK